LPGSFLEAAANEEITNYPSTVDLINAIKYLDEQGRFRNWFLKRHYRKTYATIKNTETDGTEKKL
jgi:hypothetical protein